MIRWKAVAAGSVAILTLAATFGTFDVQTSAAASGRQLVLYEAEGYAAAVAAAFQKKTGIQVSVVHLPTGGLVAKIEAERSNPHWDVVWSDGDSTMRALANQGLMLSNYTPKDIGDYTLLGRQLLPADHAYFPTGVTAAAIIAYNTKLLKPSQAPHSLSDLLKPMYRNEIAMNDPSISGPTYPFVAGILQTMGMAKGKQYFLDLKKNGLQVYPKNGPTLQAMLQGKAKIVLIQNTALIDARLQGEPVRYIYPSTGTFVLPGTIAIAKHAPDMGPAKEFVQFALSAEGQSIMRDYSNGGSDSFFSPVIRGVKPNPHSPNPAYIHWVFVNPIVAGSEESSVLQWFSDNIVH